MQSRQPSPTLSDSGFWWTLPFAIVVCLGTLFSWAMLSEGTTAETAIVLDSVIGLAGIGAIAGLAGLVRSGRNHWLWGFLGVYFGLGMAGFFSFGMGLFAIALIGGIYTVVVSRHLHVPAIDWTGVIFETIGFSLIVARSCCWRESPTE